MSDDLVTKSVPTSEVEECDDILKVGQWCWVKCWKRNYNGETEQEEEPVEVDPWLGCVTHIGSNYAALSGVYENHKRIHFDKFDELIARRELDPKGVIKSKIAKHRTKSELLLDRVKQLTAKLGIVPREELAANVPERANANALAVAHGTADITAHRNALIKAKEETLPALFKQVEEQHEQMATWMKAELIPMCADMRGMQARTGSIEDRIFTVELYAGLTESAVKIRDGEPAPNGTKIHLFQRRHYMDEECLVDYKTGGMDFKSIGQFDRWLMKAKNRKRIFPHPRCVVAFQVRRNDKERNAVSIADFICFAKMAEKDKSTFLYVRNGEQYFWIETSIDFGHRLFPDQNQSTLLGEDALFMEVVNYRVVNIITEREYDAKVAEADAKKAEHKKKLAAWKKLSKKAKENHLEPWRPSLFRSERYKKMGPGSIFYDDAVERIGKEAKKHNRVAVVLQGLLDRSQVFHPHPPWRLWTPEGFAAGIELVYDDSRVLEPGDMPDFYAYFAELNKSIKRGTNTIGQEHQWMRHEAEKENNRPRTHRYDTRDHTTFQPYGNPGPGHVAEVVSMSRGGDTCTFKWERERLKTKWIPNPDKPRWMKPDPSGIKTQFKCPKKFLFNVDAYTPGDYKQFYDDHRMRALYLKWAPLLLAAEDFHAQKKKT